MGSKEMLTFGNMLRSTHWMEISLFEDMQTPLLLCNHAQLFEEEKKYTSEPARS